MARVRAQVVISAIRDEAGELQGFGTIAREIVAREIECPGLADAALDAMADGWPCSIHAA